MISGTNWQEETLGEDLARAGISRCSFMKLCGTMATIPVVGVLNVGEAVAQLLTPSAEEITDRLSAVKKPKVAWLQLQECTGCMESVLCSGGTTAEDVVLNLVSMDYNKLLMAPPGYTAEKALDDMNAGDHILVANGSIPAGENGVYCAIGSKSVGQVLFEVAEKAMTILAVDACAIWGSVQAAKPDPTGAKGVGEVIKDKPMISISGCPPIGEVITATLTYVLTYGKAPEVDAEGRPKFAYDQRTHNSCLCRAHFDIGQFMRTFDDEGVRNDWCLYEIGYKGPSTSSPYPIVQWNPKFSWPIGADHSYTGCTEKDPFNQFTPLYDELSGILGVGVESNVDKVGIGLLAATTAGTAAHGGFTLVKELKIRCSNGEERVLATFDGVGGRKPPMVDLPSNSPSAQSETVSDLKDN